jgi:hypothetical protein
VMTSAIFSPHNEHTTVCSSTALTLYTTLKTTL